MPSDLHLKRVLLDAQRTPHKFNALSRDQVSCFSSQIRPEKNLKINHSNTLGCEHEGKPSQLHWTLGSLSFSSLPSQPPAPLQEKTRPNRAGSVSLQKKFINVFFCIHSHNSKRNDVHLHNLRPNQATELSMIRTNQCFDMRSCGITLTNSR